MIRESFVLRILAITFIFFALPLILASFILFQSSYENTVQRTKNELKNAAEDKTFSLVDIRPVSTSFLGEVEYFLKLEDQFPLAPSPIVDAKLAGSAKEVPVDVILSLLGKGKDDLYPVIASSHKEDVGKKIVSQTNLKSMVEGGTMEYIYYEYVKDRYKFSYYLVKAILGAKSKSFLGYLLVSSAIDQDIATIFASAKKRYPEMEFALADRDTTIILDATDRNMVGQHFLPLQGADISKFLEGLEGVKIAAAPLTSTFESQGSFFEFTKNNVPQIAYVAKSPQDIGLNFITYVSKETLFAAAVRRLFIIYNVYGLIILVGGGATFWLSLYFARPLKNLSNLMNKIRAGDLSTRFVEQPWGFEINALGMIFNHTLDALLRHMQRAEMYRIEKEKNRKEIAIGYTVQRQLLPQKMPHIKNLEIAAHYHSSEVAGGDFHDVIVKENSKVAVVVADMATKGISACLYSLSVRSYLRAYTMLYDDVGHILNATNQMFCQDTLDTGMYATVIYGIYDSDNKLFTYTSCGHVPGFIRKRDGRLISLTERDIAMGLSSKVNYQPATIELLPGDLLIFYSNGITDARNTIGEKFSEERFKDYLISKRWFSAQDVAEGMIGEMKLFSEGVDPIEVVDSDATIVVVRVKDDS